MKTSYIKRSNVCVVNNVHGLLVYLLKYPKRFNETHFVIGDEVNTLIDLSDSEKTVIEIPKKSDSKVTKLIKYFKYFFYTQPILKRKFLNVSFFGQDHHFFSNVMNRTAVVIEDGERTYFDEPGCANSLHKILFPLTFKKFHGRENFTKKILLTKNNGIPKALNDKFEYVDMRYHWLNLSCSEKEKILKVFRVDTDVFLNFQSSAVILFTQPFSEEKFISELEKINMYNNILNKYDIKSVFIKPHPRETTVYGFEGVRTIQLPSHFPSQFLSFFDIHFERAITINSTAINDVSADQLIIEGVCEPKLLSRFLKSFSIDDLSKSKNINNRQHREL